MTSRKSQPETQASPLRSAALDASIAELYAAFSGRELSEGGPDACTYCCASPEAMNRIARSAPEDISREDLREYHGAAKGPGAGQDLAFLLPRILEFVAEGRDPSEIGLFALFAHYFPPMWEKLTERERAALRSYCYELMCWRLNAPASPTIGYSPMDVLEMAASGGFDVDPVLDALAVSPASDRMVDVLIDLILNHIKLWQEGRGLFETSKDYAQYVAHRLRTIISSPTTLCGLERAALADGNPRRAERASLAHQIAEVTTPDPIGPSL